MNHANLKVVFLVEKSSQDTCLDLVMLLLAYRTGIVFCEDHIKVYQMTWQLEQKQLPDLHFKGAVEKFYLNALPLLYSWKMNKYLMWLETSNFLFVHS